MRNVQDWNKYVDMLGKAVSKRPALSKENEHQAEAHPVLNRSSGQNAPRPLRKGRGPRKEETREELLLRLLDPTLSLDETARILEVCPTTVRRYTNRGILSHERSAGNQRRFKLSSVLEFREAQMQGKDTDEKDREEEA